MKKGDSQISLGVANFFEINPKNIDPARAFRDYIYLTNSLYHSLPYRHHQRLAAKSYRPHQ
jgi:hypothetical protein